MQLLVKANSFRKRAKEKELVVDDLSKATEKLKQEQTIISLCNYRLHQTFDKTLIFLEIVVIV